METNSIPDKDSNSIQDQDAYFQMQHVLLAASNHDLDTLNTLLRTNSASVQDPHTGITPLHAAIAACKPPSSPPGRIPSSADGNEDARSKFITNHEANDQNRNVVIEAAVKTVKLLLENGAIWNDLDANDETPGCLARRLGLNELYEIMVHAGYRTELMLNRLERPPPWSIDDDESNPDEEEQDVLQEPERSEANPPQPLNHDANPESKKSDTYPDSTSNFSNMSYLSSPLSIQSSRILDSSLNGVMMSWETPIMQRTAELLAPRPGLRILNVGHGMGIIDTFFQQSSPKSHHIIEAHPSVLAQMRASPAWCSPTVTIHEGRWQDICPNLIAQEQFFDVIYFDTFAEDYKALWKFMNNVVAPLLDEKGRWGFFNGLGADRQVCYDVYRLVVETDLDELLFDTKWWPVQVPEMNENEEWEGVRRKYWALNVYQLPVCEYMDLQSRLTRMNLDKPGHERDGN